MLGLLGRVGGAQKAAAQPASKRQKRADVLDSLGLGSVAAGLGGSGLGKSAAVASTASAKSASTQKASDQKALQQWLVADEETSADNTQPEVPAQGSTEPEGPPVTTSDELPQTEADWRAPFAEAADRWRTEDSTGRVRYFATAKKLYFEWEKEMGVLYQYFPEEEQEAATNEPCRHPVWSADCPETHAEVWEVLPLPPGAPTTEVSTLPPADEELSLDIAEDNEAEGTSSSATAASHDASLMMPPPALPRKRPPPPPTFAEASSAASAASSASTTDSLQEAEGVVQGPELPSQQAKAADEEEDDGGADVLQLLGDDSDDEPLGKEDCALPAAPAERVEPVATDMDLDMFAD